MYGVCGRVCGRKHLSVDGLYSHDESRMYGMYGVCCGNLQKHDLYGLGQYRMYLLCCWIHV